MTFRTSMDRKGSWGYHHSRSFAWIDNVFDRGNNPNYNELIYRYFSVEENDPTLKLRPRALMMVEHRFNHYPFKVLSKKSMMVNDSSDYISSDCLFSKMILSRG